MLDEYLLMIEEAKKRDHRKIGKEMELFMFSDRVGKGMPIWLPKGTELRLRLQDMLRKIQKTFWISRGDVSCARRKELICNIWSLLHTIAKMLSAQSQLQKKAKSTCLSQ